MKQDTFVVASQAGDLVVRLSDGTVVYKTIRDENDDSGFASIVRVDIDEFRTRYPERVLTHLDTIDVRDMVRWTEDGGIHEPDEEWRAEREEMLAGIGSDEDD